VRLVRKSILDGEPRDAKIRMPPFGFASYFDSYNPGLHRNLRDVALKIHRPFLMPTSPGCPANSMRWPTAQKAGAGYRDEWP
jgi:hypothetical protein